MHDGDVVGRRHQTDLRTVADAFERGEATLALHREVDGRITIGVNDGTVHDLRIMTGAAINVLDLEEPLAVALEGQKHAGRQKTTFAALVSFGRLRDVDAAFR